MIDNGQVFALGQGGRMVALELNTGQRMWELNIAGISTPWLAGDWLFVVTDDSQADLRLSARTATSAGSTSCRQFEQLKAKKGQIDYSGPVLAGGRLIVAGSNGAMINIDPATGSFQSQTTVGAADQPFARSSPIRRSTSLTTTAG